MTAKTGTARKKPTNPKTAPPKITTEMTHKGDRPTQGPITFPSNCCKSKIKRATQIACIGFYFLKTPYVALFAFIIFITNIIPYFGPIIGAIFPIAMTLLINPMQAIKSITKESKILPII